GEDTPIVPAADACEIVASAEAKVANTAPPSGTRLPVEPAWALPADAIKEVASRRAGSLNPYQISSTAFDVAFITPVITYGAQVQAEQVRRARSSGTRTTEPTSFVVRANMDFGNWSDYVEDFPPVLLIRITPKQAEGFWTTVARGAAQTQGVSVPPIKRFTGSFSRMRIFCGNAEVTPIHPFKIERSISDSDAVYEGLYAVDP